MKYVLVLLLATGCVGSRGTRGRAYAVGTGLTAAGTAGLVAGFNVDGRDGVGLAVTGSIVGVVGLAGILLTAIGQVGESTRESRPPLVAVRPWVTVEERVAFTSTDGSGASGTGLEAVEAAKQHDCERAGALVDRVWALDRTVHGRLVRDPAVASCIVPVGGIP